MFWEELLLLMEMLNSNFCLLLFDSSLRMLARFFGSLGPKNESWGVKELKSIPFLCFSLMTCANTLLVCGCSLVVARRFDFRPEFWLVYFGNLSKAQFFRQLIAAFSIWLLFWPTGDTGKIVNCLANFDSWGCWSCRAGREALPARSLRQDAKGKCCGSNFATSHLTTREHLIAWAVVCVS